MELTEKTHDQLLMQLLMQQDPEWRKSQAVLCPEIQKLLDLTKQPPTRPVTAPTMVTKQPTHKKKRIHTIGSRYR